ncbi:hypothetical protein [Comamonas resistens]|uniref:hypothetical protein n=1 Tax=Comamonas resistens TaxID=3046670 RepID=UPI0039BC2C60
MDRGSVQFTGKVEQAAAGDLINKAPQYSNSVNVNIAPSAPARSGQVLTSSQKDVLAKLILKLADKRQCDQLEIWRVVLARAGANKAREIPIEEYRQLEDFVRAQLSEATDMPAAAPIAIADPPPLAPVAMSLPASPEGAPVVSPPTQSAAAPKALHFLATGGLLIAVASGAAVLETRSQVEQLSGRILAVQHSCQYAGQPYSLGSVVSHASGPMRCEVAMEALDGFAQWVADKPTREKRAK